MSCVFMTVATSSVYAWMLGLACRLKRLGSTFQTWRGPGGRSVRGEAGGGEARGRVSQGRPRDCSPRLNLHAAGEDSEKVHVLRELREEEGF